MKTIMKRRKAVVGAVVLFAALGSYAMNQGTYYTKVNIWYENPEKIFSTNYHVGRILKAGTKVIVTGTDSGDQVRVSGLGGRQIRFTDPETAISYIMTYVPRHSSISFEEYFERHFSETEPVFSFSKKEMEHIRRGTIGEGMCKEAVIVAYGYPPSHKTPSVKLDLWIYWVSRYNTRHVRFDGDKVFEVVN